MHSFQSQTLIFKTVKTFDIMADVFHVSSNQCLVSKNAFRVRNNLIFWGTDTRITLVWPSVLLSYN